MARILDEEQTKMMVNMGALGYLPPKISILMDIDVQEIEDALKDPNSAIHKAYKKGEYLSEYKIDLKLLEMAQSGDIKAMEKIEIKQFKRQQQAEQEKQSKKSR